MRRLLLHATYRHAIHIAATPPCGRERGRRIQRAAGAAHTILAVLRALSIASRVAYPLRAAMCDNANRARWAAPENMPERRSVAALAARDSLWRWMTSASTVSS